MLKWDGRPGEKPPLTIEEFRENKRKENRELEILEDQERIGYNDSFDEDFMDW